MTPFDLLVKAQHADLPTTQRTVYIAICSYASKDLTAYPSHGRIAEQTGLGMSTVKRDVKSLVDAGWLKVLRAGGPNSGSNLYKINFIKAKEYSTKVVHDMDDVVHDIDGVVQEIDEGGTGDSPELPNELSNELNTPQPPKGGEAKMPQWFDRYADRIWKTYPKKRDKKKSMAQLRKLVAKNDSRPLLATLLNHVRLRRRIDPDGQYWPTLDRMIRDEKYRDELPGLGMTPTRIVSAYHKTLPSNPPCTGLSRRRLENLAKLWEGLGRSDSRMADYFQFCAGLPGVVEARADGWQPDFGYLTNPDNFRDICDGVRFQRAAA